MNDDNVVTNLRGVRGGVFIPVVINPGQRRGLCTSRVQLTDSA